MTSGEARIDRLQHAAEAPSELRGDKMEHANSIRQVVPQRSPPGAALHVTCPGPCSCRLPNVPLKMGIDLVCVSRVAEANMSGLAS